MRKKIIAIAAALIMGVSGLTLTTVQAETAPQYEVKQENGKLIISRKGKTRYSCKLNKQTKYTKSKTWYRTSPAYKAKSQKIYGGKKVITYGVITNNTGNKYYIVKKNKKYYFMKKEYMTSQKPTTSPMIYTPNYFRSAGVIHWNGWRWTWYSQRVLPGGGLRIPGRHVNSNGYVCDGNGYICLASSSLRRGTVVSTPFGAKGKVYDSGCAYGTLDVYCNF